MARAKKKPPADETPKPEPTKNDWTKQRYEPRVLSALKQHPENPHKGDEDAIDESVGENGAFGALGVQASTGYILHGNHTYKRLLARGLTEFACIVYDVDDDLARRIMVAHNETQRGGKTDERKMADVLASLSTTRGLGLKPPDVSRLLEMARPKLGFLENMRREEAEAVAAREAEESDEPTGDDPEGGADEPGGEDFENEEAAGQPDADDASEGDIPDFEPVRNMDAPRFPIPLVVSRRTLDRWGEYKKRIGERRDRDAFEVLLAAAMNSDPPGDA